MWGAACAPAQALACPASRLVRRCSTSAPLRSPAARPSSTQRPAGRRMAVPMASFEEKLGALPEAGAFVLFKGGTRRDRDGAGGEAGRRAASQPPPARPCACKEPSLASPLCLPAADWCPDCVRSTSAVQQAVAAAGAQLLMVDVADQPAGLVGAVVQGRAWRRLAGCCGPSSYPTAWHTLFLACCSTQRHAPLALLAARLAGSSRTRAARHTPRHATPAARRPHLAATQSKNLACACSLPPPPGWKTPAHPLRSDPRFRLGGIPTLVHWQGGRVAAKLGEPCRGCARTHARAHATGGRADE